MANNPEIIFYDIPSNGKTRTWGPNTWKTRLALNYKGINYKTEWVEYPDLEPKFKAAGIPPNDLQTNSALYTAPTVQVVATGEYIMDSKKISQVLEKLKPEPSLHLDDPLISKVENTLPEISMKMRGNVFSHVPPILPERSANYFSETRKKRFGMPLEELAKAEGGQEYYEKAKPVFQEKAALLEANGGPFLNGTEFSYADAYLLSTIEFYRFVNPQLYEQVAKEFPAWKRLHDAGTEKGLFAKVD